MAAVFVTVGSTQFSGLVGAILSQDCLEIIAKSGRESSDRTPKVTIQYGSTPIADVLTSSSALLSSVTAQQEDLLAGKNLVQKIMYQRRARDVYEEGTMKMSLATANAAADGGSSVTGSGTLGEDHRERIGSVCLRVATHQGPVDLELVDYVADVRPFMRAADFVLTHAGGSHIPAHRVMSER